MTWAPTDSDGCMQFHVTVVGHIAGPAQANSSVCRLTDCYYQNATIGWPTYRGRSTDEAPLPHNGGADRGARSGSPTIQSPVQRQQLLFSVTAII